MSIRSKESLIEHINKKNSVKYIFFWGHQKPKSGISKTCFSQWYPSPFEIDGHLYQTAEHYMMAEKALLFKDLSTFEKIIAAKSPAQAKKLGRMVQGFNEPLWIEKRFDLVVRGNLAKFSQNKPLKEFLLNTGKSILVEASPVDKIWGAGMAHDNSAINNPLKWRGLNLLGFALMEVRKRLS